jgi:hypothetical protein
MQKHSVREEREGREEIVNAKTLSPQMNTDERG